MGPILGYVFSLSSSFYKILSDFAFLGQLVYNQSIGDMTRAEERVKRLIENAKAQGLTKLKIAKAMGITPQHLSSLLSGKNEWKLVYVEALCGLLGISLAEAFLEPGEDVELFVLLRKILDAGPEPYRAIAWNIEGIAEKIANSGPKLERKPAKMAAIKTSARTTKRGRYSLPPGTDIGPKFGSAIVWFSTILGSLL